MTGLIKGLFHSALEHIGRGGGGGEGGNADLPFFFSVEIL